MWREGQGFFLFMVTRILRVLLLPPLLFRVLFLVFFSTCDFFCSFLVKAIQCFQEDNLKRCASAKAFQIDRNGVKVFFRDVYYYLFRSGLISCYVDDTLKRGKLVIHSVVPFTDAQIEGVNHGRHFFLFC